MEDDQITWDTMRSIVLFQSNNILCLPSYNTCHWSHCLHRPVVSQLVSESDSLIDPLPIRGNSSEHKRFIRNAICGRTKRDHTDQGRLSHPIHDQRPSTIPIAGDLFEMVVQCAQTGRNYQMFSEVVTAHLVLHNCHRTLPQIHCSRGIRLANRPSPTRSEGRSRLQIIEFRGRQTNHGDEGRYESRPGESQ